MSQTLSQQHQGELHGKAALAAGVLSVLAFVGVGFALNGWYFLIGVVIGAGAIALAVTARRRPAASRSDRRMAMTGLVLGTVIVGWFVAFMAVAAIR